MSLAFTCVVPVWAGDPPDWFDQALDSLAASSRLPDEILICQDGPLSAPLADLVAGAGARLGARVTSNPGPRGLQHNLNHAMAQVRTPYAARFDADDINLPDRFALQTEFADAHPEVAAHGGTIVEFAPDGATRRKTMPLTHEAILRYAAWRNPINHMTAFLRLDVFRAVGGYPDIRRKEDYGLWLRMLAAGERLANLPDDLVRARLGEGLHRRRAGLGNIASEWAIYELKRGTPDLNAGAAAAALLARSATLALSGATRLAYDGVLRR